MQKTFAVNESNTFGNHLNDFNLFFVTQTIVLNFIMETTNSKFHYKPRNRSLEMTDENLHNIFMRAIRLVPHFTLKANQ